MALVLTAKTPTLRRQVLAMKSCEYRCEDRCEERREEPTPFTRPHAVVFTHLHRVVVIGPGAPQAREALHGDTPSVWDRREPPEGSQTRLPREVTMNLLTLDDTLDALQRS